MMTETEKYIIELVLDDIKDNIDNYLYANEKIFMDLKHCVGQICEITNLSENHKIYPEFILTILLDNLKKIISKLKYNKGDVTCEN